MDFLPSQDDINLIYKYPDEYKGNQKQPFDTFLDMFSKFPAQPEDVSVIN